MDRRWRDRLLVLCFLYLAFFLVSIAIGGTIQDAIDAASPGDTVVIPPGTYDEWGITFRGKAIALLGNGVVTVNGRNHDGIFFFQNGEEIGSVLDGFTITGSRGNSGAIYIANASPTIRNCIIRDNFGDSTGGGIRLENASPIIQRCIIRDNIATLGGGIAGSEGSSPVIMECIIVRNAASQGGAGIYLTAHSSPSITKSTIADNQSSVNAGGLYCRSSSNPTVRNSIFWGDSPRPVWALSSSPDITYSDVGGGWPGESNLDVDPMLESDYSLNDRSPVIGKASDLSDMGAIENPRDTPLPVTFSWISASKTPEGTWVSWSTSMEINVLGFNVFWSEKPDGPWQKLTGKLIQPGKGKYSFLSRDYDSGFFRVEEFPGGDSSDIAKVTLSLATTWAFMKR